MAGAVNTIGQREARLLGLDMPTKVAVTDPDRGIPLETIRRVMERGIGRWLWWTLRRNPSCLLDSAQPLPGRSGQLRAKCRSRPPLSAGKSRP
jgi:hypothetical protein